MSQYANIVLERPDGTHNLNFGEYVCEKTETATTLYIGIGTFGQGGGGGGGGGIIPSGTLEITENGTYNIRLYEYVNVNVQAQPPTATIQITENGTVDVTNYATAEVNVQPEVIDTIVRALFTDTVTESYEADLTLT